MVCKEYTYMPIAKFNPVDKPDIKPNLPKTAPKEYKSPARDEKIIPVDNLLAYVSGTEWSIDYFSQLSAQTNDLREVDPGEHPVYQQYTLTKGYVLKVTSPLESSYDNTSGINKVTGSSNMFSFIIPNVSDYFVSDAGESRTGLFRITNVDRKSFNAETVYEISYDLVGYIDTAASSTIYQNVLDKVIRTYYFDMQRFKDGLYPLVLEEARQKLIDYSIAYRDICRYYFNTFFNRHYMTLVLPGQAYSVYDPFLVNYIMKIVETEVVPELRELRTFSTENDPYMKQAQFWSMMYERDINMLQMMNKKMGLATRAQFNTNSYIHGFKYTNLEYMVYPIDNSDMGQIVDVSSRVGMTPEVKFNSYVFQELLETKNGNGVNSSSIVDNYSDTAGVHKLSHGIISSDYYVLSNRFYNNASDMSIVEILTKDYIKGNTIDVGKLEFFLERYKLLARLEQFYYGPILITLLKEVIRTSHL